MAQAERKITEYTCGFLFDPSATNVALIKKNRPNWMAGQLNGIGGHSEEGESAIMTQIREFREETGVEIGSWRLFTVLGDNLNWRVHFFVARSELIWEVKSVTDEVVDIFSSRRLPKNIMPNLRWLVPMAIEIDRDSVSHYSIIEAA